MGFFNIDKNFKSDKKKKEVEKKEVTYLDKLELYSNQRQDYYATLYLSIVESVVNKFSTAVLLSKVKDSYGYYRLDDIILWYDDRMKEFLLSKEIATYTNSAGQLVLTVCKDRVNSLKNR